MKAKRLHYNVCDCEHYGDIQSAMREVEAAGGNVTGYHWENEGNDEDGGDAWVTFTCDESQVEQIKNELGEYEVW